MELPDAVHDQLEFLAHADFSRPHTAADVSLFETTVARPPAAAPAR